MCREDAVGTPSAKIAWQCREISRREAAKLRAENRPSMDGKPTFHGRKTDPQKAGKPTPESRKTDPGDCENESPPLRKCVPNELI